MNAPFPIRKECPPGACVCGRVRLLDDPQAVIRGVRLSKEEEKRLIARLEDVQTLDDLRRMQEKMHALLGITVTIEPSIHGVRTVRGLQEDPADQSRGDPPLSRTPSRDRLRDSGCAGAAGRGLKSPRQDGAGAPVQFHGAPSAHARSISSISRRTFGDRWRRFG